MFIDANLVLSFATLLLSLMAILTSIVRKLAKIEAQVLPNSGTSISDKVNSIDKRLAVLEAQLNK
jgi:hypothetical protein